MKKKKNFKKKIKKFKFKNIFFINKNEIKNLINSNSLIENYKILKKYPSTIKY